MTNNCSIASTRGSVGLTVLSPVAPNTARREIAYETTAKQARTKIDMKGTAETNTNLTLRHISAAFCCGTVESAPSAGPKLHTIMVNRNGHVHSSRKYLCRSS